jgi:hypothetical protein
MGDLAAMYAAQTSSESASADDDFHVLREERVDDEEEEAEQGPDRNTVPARRFDASGTEESAAEGFVAEESVAEAPTVEE